MSVHLTKLFLMSSLSLLAVDAAAQKSDADILKDKQDNITAYLDTDETIIPFSSVSAHPNSQNSSLNSIPNVQQGWYDVKTILAHAKDRDNISYTNEANAARGRDITHTFSVAGLRDIQDGYSQSFAQFGMDSLRIMLLNVSEQIAEVIPVEALAQRGIKSDSPVFAFSTSFFENHSLRTLLDTRHHEKKHVHHLQNVNDFHHHKHRYETQSDSVMAESIGFEQAKHVLKEIYWVQEKEALRLDEEGRKLGIESSHTTDYLKSFEPDPTKSHPPYGFRLLMLELLQDAKNGDSTLYNAIKQKNNL